MSPRTNFFATVLIASFALSSSCNSVCLANSLKKLLQPVTKVAQPEKPDIRDKWAILVGVNRFTDSAIPPLKFALKSSADLARALKDQDSGHFGLDHVLTVNGADASKVGIERSFNEWLFRKALPADMVVIYINSRLLKSASGAAIVCANDTKVEDADKSGINLTELIKSAKQRIGSPNIIVMLDLPPAVADEKAPEGMNLKSLATSTGVTILSGADIFKPNNENPQYMQSRFVHYLVEALKSGGATFPVAMLAEYVWQKVKQESTEAGGPEQTPVLALASEQSLTSGIPLGIMVKSSLPPSSISVGHPADNMAMDRPDIVPMKASSLANNTPTIGAKLQSRNPEDAPISAVKAPAKAGTTTTLNSNGDGQKIAATAATSASSTPANNTGAGKAPAGKEEEEDDSFDQNLDMAPYMTKMKQDIKTKWQMPKGLETRRVVTVFSIMRNGKIANVEITEGSGNAEVDKSALAALEAASLDPLPKGAPPSVDIKYIFDWKTRQGN